MGKGDSRRVIHPDIGARNLTLNYSVFEPRQEFPQHTHDNSEDIFIVLEGGVSVRQGNTYHPITKGDVVFVPQGEIHGTVNTTDAQAILISFQGPPDPALYSGERDPSVKGEVPKPPLGHRSKIQIEKLAEGKKAYLGSLGILKVVDPSIGAKNLNLNFVNLSPGEKVPDHLYSESEEVWVLLEGEAIATLRESNFAIKAGDVVFLSPGEVLGLANPSASKTIFVSCVAPPAIPSLFT